MEGFPHDTGFTIISVQVDLGRVNNSDFIGREGRIIEGVIEVALLEDAFPFDLRAGEETEGRCQEYGRKFVEICSKYFPEQ